MAQQINMRSLLRRKPLGIRVPIRNSDRDGVFDMTNTTLDRVKSSLYTLLFTAPGTRVMLPHFGSPIYALQFEQVGPADYDSIKTSIKRAISTWVPEAHVVDVVIAQNAERPNEFSISINYTLAANSNLSDSIKITVR